MCYLRQAPNKKGPKGKTGEVIRQTTIRDGAVGGVMYLEGSYVSRLYVFRMC